MNRSTPKNSSQGGQRLGHITGAQGYSLIFKPSFLETAFIKSKQCSDYFSVDDKTLL